MALKDLIVEALRTKGTSVLSRRARAAHAAALALGIAAMVCGTMPEAEAQAGWAIAAATWLVLGLFAVEYGLRLIYAPALSAASDVLSAREMRRRWAASYAGVVDLLAWLPILVALLAMRDQATARLFGVLWLLKFGRHVPRLGVLGRVLRHAREPVLAVFAAFIGVLLVAATLAYLLEGAAQPDTFGSIPRALWWAITTLTTTGYGDAVPVTPLGRVLAGAVMVCGILVFALWAGILATEFAEEMRRHDFLKTWDLVAKVPYFEKLGPDTIAEVVRLLKPRVLAPGAVVMRRGAPGDCMYFIVDGEVEIQIKPKPIVLESGSFFGEIALITGGPRTATAVALGETVLLSLDIAHFRQLAATRPELMAAIDVEAKRRVAEGPG